MGSAAKHTDNVVLVPEGIGRVAEPGTVASRPESARRQSLTLCQRLERRLSPWQAFELRTFIQAARTNQTR